MNTVPTLIAFLLFLATSIVRAEGTEYRELDWVELIPDHILTILENPPKELLSIPDGTEQDALTSQFEAPKTGNTAFDNAMTSAEIKPEMNNQKISLAGFIVPLEFNEDLVLKSFFLVPYFGACIHMPPPPPNQIIYVELDEELQMESLYTPYVVYGTLLTETIKNDTAMAAYRIKVDNMEIYEW